MEDQNIYRHTPLESKRSIRLVEIPPFKKDRHEQLSSLNIIQCSLDDDVHYEALSYAWDSPKPDTAIPCSGKHILVTANCEAALRRLRRKSRVRLVWIDAVCIDQDAILERNHQVSMMGEIYMKAVCTLVWLGPGTPDSDWVFRCLRLVHFLRLQGTKLSPQTVLIFQRLFRGLHTVHRYQNGAPGKSFKNLKGSVQDVGNRSYWSRMWTLQEVGLSRHAKLYCGFAKPVPLRFVRLTLDLFRSVQLSQASLFHMMMSLWTYPEQRPALSLLFNQILNKVSSDPRDKVFAFKALYPASLGQVVVDYERSVEETYIDATKLIIEREKSLILLCYTNRSSSYPDLPSWTPDWNTTDTTYEISYISLFHESKASKNSETSVNFFQEITKISAKGKLFSPVDWVGDRIPRAHDRMGSESESSDEIRALLGAVPDHFSILYGWAAADKTGIQSRLQAVLEVLTVISLGMDVSFVQYIGKILLLEEQDGSAGVSFALRNYLDGLIQFHLGGLTPFITSTGQMGMAFSPNLKSGDTIVAFSGLGMPMIIRAKGDGYLVVGPAVVSGMMKGEQWPDDESELQDIVLI